MTNTTQEWLKYDNYLMEELENFMNRNNDRTKIWW